jgi:L-ascorbate oxidase
MASLTQVQVIETDGHEYIMLNLINIGFEHEVRVAIDSHKLIIVANDGGFVEPSQGDVSNSSLNHGNRLTLL